MAYPEGERIFVAVRWVSMNQPPGAPLQLNPQILSATQLVIQVTRHIESLLPRAVQR
jgi:hypothetical protein